MNLTAHAYLIEWKWHSLTDAQLAALLRAYLATNDPNGDFDDMRLPELTACFDRTFEYR
jgi:hypothetical protein